MGKYIVPIIPDEARTFGMESLFRQYGIYASRGQLYKPVDSENFLFYKEATTARSSKKASPKPDPWRRSPPPAPPTPTTACR